MEMIKKNEKQEIKMITNTETDLTENVKNVMPCAQYAFFKIRELNQIARNKIGDIKVPSII